MKKLPLVTALVLAVAVALGGTQVKAAPKQDIDIIVGMVKARGATKAGSKHLVVKHPETKQVVAEVTIGYEKKVPVFTVVEHATLTMSRIRPQENADFAEMTKQIECVVTYVDHGATGRATNLKITHKCPGVSKQEKQQFLKIIAGFRSSYKMVVKDIAELLTHGLDT